jgi:hypothetical protein
LLVGSVLLSLLLLQPLSLLLLLLLLLSQPLSLRMSFAVAVCCLLACVTCPPAHTPASLRVRKSLQCALWLEHHKGTALRGLVLPAMLAPPWCRQAGVHMLSLCVDLIALWATLFFAAFTLFACCVMSKHALMRGSCC